MLKRIAAQLERANDLTEARLNLEHPEWSRIKRYEKKFGQKPRSPKAVEFGTMNIEELNRRWDEAHAEE
jgi:hypothetical protein